MKLTFVQDIASPHNNVLIQAMENSGDRIDVDLYYCHQSADKYDWKQDLRHAVKPAQTYLPNKPDVAFLKNCLFPAEKNTKLLVVGWMNLNTKLLLILHWLLRKPYNIWFDFPQDSAPRSPLSNALRNVFYWLLKTSKAKVFCVGQLTVDYFKKKGFPENRLVNLPVFFELANMETVEKEAPKVRQKYGVKEDDFFIVTGSRLVYDKGYDLVISALAALPQEVKDHVKCVIIGKGEEEDNLKAQAAASGLTNSITFEPWMEVADFRNLVAAGDIFLHPARFDAFGGALIGMALGRPVIGSTGAGASVDRIEHGVNGWLFENENVAQLTTYILEAYHNREQLEEMAKAAFRTAQKWSPEQGVAILEKELIS